jgi:peptidoglycan hydrolase-like protein with peptidoglycan-binding domain
VAVDQWLHNTRGIVVVVLMIATGVLLLSIDPGNGFPQGASVSSGGGGSTPTTTLAPATTTVPTVSHAEIQEGSTNTAEVTVLQQRLAVLGFAVTADGSFGPGTKAAVQQFQTSKGLPATGVVDAATWKALGV